MNWKNMILFAVLLLFVSSVSVMAEEVEVDGQDLYIASYSVMPKPVVLGEPVTLTLEIRSIGYMDVTDSFQVEFQVCHPDGSNCHIADGEEVNGLSGTKEIVKEITIKESDVVNGKTLIKFVVDGDANVIETNEDNNVYSMLVNVVDEVPVEEVISGSIVKFPVSVNDYPNHGNKDLTKIVANGYVNMYTVKLVEDAFKVVDTETKFTGSDGIAEFDIKPGQMVYFEGFLTEKGAEKGAEAKQALLWTAPPFKNFGEGKIHQTHWTEINDYLKYSKSYSGASWLSTPYQDVGKVVLVPETESQPDVEEITEEVLPVENNNDLKVTAVGYGNQGFKATICNAGTNDLSGFKISFHANEKDNVLTYAATSSAGNCMTLNSWSYSYFGVSKEDFVPVVVMVDPYNELVEFNENNNEMTNAGENKPMLPAYNEEEIVTEAEKPKGMLPAYDENKQVKKPLKCLSGCAYESKCLPVGTKIKENGDSLFCDWNGEMKDQLPEGKFCQNDYECESNSCMSGKCLDLEKKLEEQQNLLEKIMMWLQHFFK
jgi:hypothetical protein